MSGLLDELRAKWNQALASSAGHREWRAVALSGAFPVRLLAAIRNNDGRIGILIETALQHAPRHRVRFKAEGILDFTGLQALTLVRVRLQEGPGE